MSDHKLFSSFAVSSLIHLILVVPAVSLLMHAKVHKVQLVPVQLVDVPPLEETKEADLTQRQPKATEPKAQKVTPPKLLSKPDIFEIPAVPTIGNIKKEIKEPEKPLEKLPPFASPAHPGWSPGEAEGSGAGTGNLF